MAFETVAIVGVGLIGGSFAVALRKAGFEGRILGVSSPATIEAARAAAVVDEGATLGEAAAQADLIFLAHAIARIIENIAELGPLVRPGTLITDAGSTKAAIAEAARRAIPGHATFLGGHPMAGKETRGVNASDPDLFENRTWFLAPQREEDEALPAVAAFIEWVRRIGANPVTITAAGHDRLVSITSHLAQMSSTALASVAGQELEFAQAAAGAGPGLHDMTRLARSGWDIWQDIVDTNTGAIGAALDLYIAELTRLRGSLGTSAFREHFENGAAFAHRLKAHRKT